MKCVALRHVAFEDLGVWEAEIRANGYAVDYVDAGVDDLAPVRDADLAIVLGGPHGVRDAALFPSIDEASDLIHARLAASLPTLGVCLGAQLIAHACGWEVRKGTLELGWGEVDLSVGAMATPLRHFARVPQLHWHGDEIVPPPGHEVLASTPAVACQAFVAGSALGIQFHPEIEGEVIERWLIGHSVELRANGVDVAALRARTRDLADASAMAGVAFIRDYVRAIGAPG